MPTITLSSSMMTFHPALAPVIPQVWTMKDLNKFFPNAYISYILFSHIIFICHSEGTNMSPKNKVAIKTVAIEAFGTRKWIEYELEIVETINDDTDGVLET
jgi:hypothetical protein